MCFLTLWFQHESKFKFDWVPSVQNDAGCIESLSGFNTSQIESMITLEHDQKTISQTSNESVLVHTTTAAHRLRTRRALHLRACVYMRDCARYVCTVDRGSTARVTTAIVITPVLNIVIFDNDDDDDDDGDDGGDFPPLSSPSPSSSSSSSSSS